MYIYIILYIYEYMNIVNYTLTPHSLKPLLYQNPISTHEICALFRIESKGQNSTSWGGARL